MATLCPITRLGGGGVEALSGLRSPFRVGRGGVGLGGSVSGLGL